MIVLSSCIKEGISLEYNDYLVFGHFYGMCVGDQCVQTYKLTDNALYKDFRDRFNDPEPDFRPLGTDKFQLVKNLREEVPRNLLNSEKERFGCPDCADQGGIRITIANIGNVKSWTIDQRKADVPEYLYDFIDKINESIALINE